MTLRFSKLTPIFLFCLTAMLPALSRGDVRSDTPPAGWPDSVLTRKPGIWEAGNHYGALPHVLTSTDPGKLTPEEGYVWTNPGSGSFDVVCSGVVGLVFQKDANNHYFEIINVIPGLPAEAAGLRPGLWIRGIDAHMTDLATMEQGRLWLSGLPGDTVTLQLFDPESDTILPAVTLRRAARPDEQESLNDAFK